VIERAIENWLTNTTERSYQAPFCQVLVRNGHRVLYSSTHGVGEEGKDVISIDKSGNCFAYQLKTGNINVSTWRLISGEVRELVELPVLHPSVDPKRRHRSILVTNGQITDGVRERINHMNDDNRRKRRRYSQLDVVERSALLRDFIDAQGGFIPNELRQFNLFLKFFLADGNDFLDKDAYFEFFNQSLSQSLPKPKSRARDAISSSVIVAACMLHPYERVGNHYALFEAWTCLAGLMIRCAHRTGLGDRDWRESLGIALSEVFRSLCALRDEAISKEHLLEGNLLGDGGLMYRARATLLMGCLAALGAHLHANAQQEGQEGAVLEFIQRNKALLWFWGESAFPHIFSVVKYLELKNQRDDASSLSRSLLNAVICSNSPRREVGIPNPYYAVNDVLESAYGVSSSRTDLGQFAGSSYCLPAIIEMLARRGERALLSHNWRQISHIGLREFKPDKLEDWFLWRVENGVNDEEFRGAPKSWSALLQQAKDLSALPELFREHAGLLRFFILACPHRANRHIIRLLDNA